MNSLPIWMSITFFQEDEYVKGEKYKADGEYYPKILFLGKNFVKSILHVHD